MLRIPVTIEIGSDAVETIREYLSSGGPAAVKLGPTPKTTASRSAPTGSSPVELPQNWELVEERSGETYHWPQGDDEYVTFRIYEGHTSAGSIRLAIGECERVAVRGRDRKYFITHYITPAGSKRPISEFLETDDYAETGDLIAIIKGSDGGSKMYDPTGHLPPEYKGFRIEVYRDRVDAWGSYTKLAIVANENDVNSILAHTLIQAQSRFGYRPE